MEPKSCITVSPRRPLDLLTFEELLIMNCLPHNACSVRSFFNGPVVVFLMFADYGVRLPDEELVKEYRHFWKCMADFDLTVH
jgi:hypothetical protein